MIDWQNISTLENWRDTHSYNTYAVIVDNGDGPFEDTCFGIDDIPKNAKYFIPLPPNPDER